MDKKKIILLILSVFLFLGFVIGGISILKKSKNENTTNENTAKINYNKQLENKDKVKTTLIGNDNDKDKNIKDGEIDNSKKVKKIINKKSKVVKKITEGSSIEEDVKNNTTRIKSSSGVVFDIPTTSKPKKEKNTNQKEEIIKEYPKLINYKKKYKNKYTNIQLKRPNKSMEKVKDLYNKKYELINNQEGGYRAKKDGYTYQSYTVFDDGIKFYKIYYIEDGKNLEIAINSLIKLGISLTYKEIETGIENSLNNDEYVINNVLFYFDGGSIGVEW